MSTECYITGVGCISKAGRNVSEMMSCLYGGHRSPEVPQRMIYKLPKHYPVFEISGVDAAIDNISLHFAEIATAEALKQSGIDERLLQQKKVGFVLGSSSGCFFNKEEYYGQHRQADAISAEYFADVLFKGNIAHHLAEKYAAHGMCLTISNACASGTDAIGLGSQLIKSGECDIVIAGGCDELARMVYLGFISLMNTSEYPCKPFSATRSGLNLGEGAGICVLESAASLEQRHGRERVLGTIAGYATCCDSYHVTAPEPDGRGLRTALASAMQQAGLTPSEIAFVNAHGTGTTENDKVEGKVLADVFGSDVVVSATKAYTGHTLGAAGALEAIISLQCLLNGQIPAVPDYDDFDPECRVTLACSNRRIEGQYACSTSLAFGGINSVLVIGKTK